MKSILSYTLAAVLLALTGCSNKQERFANRMVGTWNITHETIEQIYSDGDVVEESDQDDIGTLLLEEQEGIGDVFLDYTLQLNGVNYPWNRLPFKTDEERKRVFFYNFFCNDLFGCDLVCTLVEDEPNRQVWQFIRRNENLQGVYHRKVTWTLERE